MEGREKELIGRLGGLDPERTRDVSCGRLRHGHIGAVSRRPLTGVS
jgi:hypothetical protein